MDIKIVRWHNARLIRALSQQPLKLLSITLDRDPALVGKWFAKDGFKKVIGTDIARHIELSFATIIISQCNAFSSAFWLDEPHEDLWLSKLGVAQSKNNNNIMRHDYDPFARSEIVEGLAPLFQALEKAYGINGLRFTEYALLSIELHSKNVGLQGMATGQILSYHDINLPPAENKTIQTVSTKVSTKVSTTDKHH